ncbi:MAG TPA: helix-turn-helix transcriptional regulator [Gemmatimonadaceae bacterium]|nr:helix-turn-helix transcriptional regulator [Gemmatimonadaceae bacterium]
MGALVLGELEQVVLLAALRVGDDAYGVTVLHEIARQTGRELTLATVHKTLARLEEKGYVTSRMGEPTPTRGGRRKRHYAVTPAGRQAVRASLAALRRLARGLAVGWDTP